MPIDETEAIVLRASPLGELDKLVVLFSREKGLIRGVAKGARKFGNRFCSSLEPMSLVRVIFYEKEQRELVTISNCDLVESFFEMQKEPRTAFLMAYFVELIEEFFPIRAREDLLFRLLISVLRQLKQGGESGPLAAYFEAWFLRLNGFLPSFSVCRGCRKPLRGGWLGPRKDGAFCDECAEVKKEEVPPETAAFLAWVSKNPPPKAVSQTFSAGELGRIRRVLQSIIIYHMEKEPRSLQFLKENHDR
jgi:DNA repair protein RecO (recombination protein O)